MGKQHATSAIMKAEKAMPTILRLVLYAFSCSGGILEVSTRL